MSVDSSAVMLIFNSNWKHGVELSPPLQLREIGFLSTHPGYRDKLLTLMGPFNWQVWLGTAVSLVAVFCCLLLLARYHYVEINIPLLLGFTSVTWGVAINESVPHKYLSIKTYPSNQVLLTFWIPMSCLLSLAFQSNLLAALVKVSQISPIDSFEDILYEDMTIYVAKGTLIVHLLSTSPDPLAREAFQKSILDKGGLYSLNGQGQVPQDILDAVDRGKGVIDALRSRLPIVAHKWRMLRETQVGHFFCGYYFSLNNPWLEGVRPIMKTIKESGIYAKYYEEEAWNLGFASRQHERTTPPKSDWKKLSLGHVASAASLIIPMSLVAIVIFLQEMLVRASKPMNILEKNITKTALIHMHYQ